MTDKDRIAALERRVAELEARLAAQETRPDTTEPIDPVRRHHPYIAPWDPLHPLRVTCRPPEVPVSCSGPMEVAMQSETFRTTLAELEALEAAPQ